MVPEHIHTLLVMISFWEDLAVFSVFQLLLSFLGSSSKEQMDAFEQQEPTRMMWVLSPIVCVCCYSCMTLRKPTASDLAAIWVFVLQFMVFNPICATVEASTIEPKAPFIVLRLCSLFLVVYAIVVMIEGIYGALATRRPHLKFWALKGLLITCAIIRRVIQHHANASSVETAGAVAAIVAAPFAMAMYFAYPSEDLGSSGKEEDAQESTPYENIVAKGA